jgi:hypothetical protein
VQHGIKAVLNNAVLAEGDFVASADSPDKILNVDAVELTSKTYFSQTVAVFPVVVDTHGHKTIPYATFVLPPVTVDLSKSSGT